VVATLQQLKAQGLIRAIGFSGKTVEGAHASLRWADVLMVEYHLEDRSHEDVIAQAASQGVGVVVKKGLASGRLPAEQAIEFILANPGVSSLIIGGLNLNHIRSNVEVARRVLGG
jgi:aryl-alcohol dehydrogenase-like predicted oxidoreductase